MVISSNMHTSGLPLNASAVEQQDAGTLLSCVLLKVGYCEMQEAGLNGYLAGLKDPAGIFL